MLLKKKCKAIIFDMDGTLVDTEPIYYDINKKLYNSLKINHSPAMFASLRGISSRLKWTHLKKANNLKLPIDQLMYMSKIMKFVCLKESKIESIDGVIPLLTELKMRQIPIGLATSASRLIADLLLDKMQLHEFFDFTICGDEVKNGKPNPDIFIEAALGLSTNQDGCLVIEDSINGLVAAKKAGMICIAHQSKISDQNLTKADLIISDYNSSNRMKILDFFDD